MPWTWDPNVKDVELRQARAAEYIAQYLDRIERHLAKIAESVEVMMVKM
jgi:hypothetical protein